ncbi:hypothetical protein CPLU01_15523 [Colletotrichum plurivorum]|uniref:AAA+ ATPase domain-containing protein n=1 Tax=Colletotrichum plurivorum TaxID=2175906 RepID=A0A8H6MV26_9PEZI|nr:hypothetical protein CPLU01_15523 [Colletotrichum plurivorum]
MLDENIEDVAVTMDACRESLEPFYRLRGSFVSLFVLVLGGRDDVADFPHPDPTLDDGFIPKVPSHEVDHTTESIVEQNLLLAATGSQKTAQQPRAHDPVPDPVRSPSGDDQPFDFNTGPFGVATVDEPILRSSKMDPNTAPHFSRYINTDGNTFADIQRTPQKWEFEQQQQRQRQIFHQMALYNRLAKRFQTGEAAPQTQPKVQIGLEGIVPSETTHDASSINELKRQIQELQRENKRLKRSGAEPALGKSTWQVFHCIEDEDFDPDEDEDDCSGAVFLSQPTWDVVHDQLHLKGHLPISDPTTYVRRKPNVTFVVHNYYTDEHRLGEAKSASQKNEPLPSPKPARQSIRIVSADMAAATEEFLNRQPNFRRDFPNLKVRPPMQAPYMWWYHYRKSRMVERLPPDKAELLGILTTWIDENYTDLYDQVDSQLKRGMVSYVSMEFLIRPEDILVSKTNDGFKCQLATSWVQSTHERSPYENPTAEQSQQDESQHLPTWSWGVHAWSYSYDGVIRKRTKTVEVLLHAASAEDEVSIGNLDNVPLRFLNQQVHATLEHRGKTFWACRKRKLVSYTDETSDLSCAAFDHLVATSDTKEIIQALITNQLTSEIGTDVIASKGNGLIMLLHGGPGTGKTFTAESVAEMAERPLYPVTCGDIGTKPEQVEAYLESVFHLGKLWGCVVLLDEAEVFLEQRTLSDLDRNALVSVFLRALEYYEGILILTSNRVGTFDEAFKSRIQLALHYEPLRKPQRRQIWKNFFDRLDSMGESRIDFANVEKHLDRLSEYQMNGRQIRNAITTARQLAQYKDETMMFTHLRHAIEVTGEFDKYLEDVHRGCADEEIAREEGVR